MKRALAALALFVALPLCADEDAAAKGKLIEELLDVFNVGTLAEAALTPPLAAPSDDDDKALQVLSGLRSDLSRDALIELFTPLFSEQFSAEELQSMLEFYKSPLGQKSAYFLMELGRPDTHRWLFLTSPKAKELEAEYDRLYNDPVKVTTTLLRTVATATEAYATDHDNEYPRVTSIEELRQLLEPTYVMIMPEEDAWETKFVYVSDGQHYRISSAGADRQFQWNAHELKPDAKPVQSDAAGLDLIIQDGDFIQLPLQEPPPPPPPPPPPEP